MIPGVTPGGAYPLSTLPSEFDESVPNPLAELLSLSQQDRQYLMIAYPTDSSGNQVTVRASSAGYASMPDDEIGVVHFPVGLISPYNVRISLVSGGRFSGAVAIPAFGDIVIANPATEASSKLGVVGRFDDILNYHWNGAPVEIYLGRRQYIGPDFSLFSRIFRGKAAAIGNDLDTISIEIRDLARSFDRPVTTRTYRGFTSALRFDSTDQVVLGSAPAALNITGNMSFECWVRLKTLPSATRLIAGWSSSPYPFRFVMLTTGEVSFFHFDGTNFASVTSTTALSPGNTYHLAWSVSGGTVTTHIYNDSTGETTTESGALSDSTRAAGSTEMRLGGGSATIVEGDFWEYRFWNDALALEDIASRRDQSLEGDEDNLVAYYPADTGTGTTLFDEGPNVINGAITGCTWVGSLEGGADLAGRNRPRVWGVRRQVPAHLVDAQRLVYQVNDGPTEAIYPYEQGLFGGWTADGDVSDIYASAPASGHYTTQLSKGLFRLGSASAGTVTADVYGDNVGSWAYTTADIIERIVTTEGELTSDDYDAASFLDVNTANDSAVGVYSGLDAARIDELLTELMNGVGGWWAFSRDARLELKIRSLASVPDASISYREVKEGGLRQISTPPAPVTRITMSYRPYEVTQTTDNLAGSLTEAEKADLGQQFRFVQTELDNAVKLRNPDAEPAERDSVFDVRRSALVEARRQFDIDRLDQELWEVPLTEGLFQYWIGTPIEIDVTRFGLDSSATYWTVAGINEDAATDQISLVLWGVRNST